MTGYSNNHQKSDQPCSTAKPEEPLTTRLKNLFCTVTTVVFCDEVSRGHSSINGTGLLN